MNTKFHPSRFLFCLLAVLLAWSSTGFGPGPQSAPPVISGTVSLWYGYIPGTAEETALLQVLINARTAYPDATILAEYKDDIFNQYQAAVLGGGGPDMFIYTNDVLGDLIRAGVLQELDTLLAGRLQNVYPDAIEGMKLNGHIYGVPESAKAVALYYNKSTVPTPPATTTDLLALVQAGKKLVIDTDGAAPYFNYGFYSAFGGQIVDPLGYCIADRGGVAESLHYLLDLKAAEATLIADHTALGHDPFINGDIDMIIDGPWVWSDYWFGLGEANAGLALLPTGSAGPSRPLNGIDGFFISPNSTNQASAVELALFMTSQASSQIFTSVAGHVPVRTDVSSGNELINTFALESSIGIPRPQMEGFAAFYWNLFSQMFTDVLSETVTPEDGVAATCQAYNTATGIVELYTYLPVLKR